MANRLEAFRSYQSNIYLFSRDIIGVPLYPYQVEPAQYIMDTIADKRNDSIVIEMPRQSGKNQLSGICEVALLARHAQQSNRDIVRAAPTWRPQIVNSKMRFDAMAREVVKRLPFLEYKPSQGYMYRCGQAVIQFLSADPHASVVGATASMLLEIDEAQDVDLAVYSKNFSPMKASSNAPSLFMGTTWTDSTLLANAKTDILEGRTAGRVFRVLPEVVADANPAYGDFVDAEVRRLGRDHPLVKTQYFLEALPSAGRMLKPDHLALMIGTHKRAEQRTTQRQIVAGIDFAGADEVAGELVSLASASARDSVALTIGAVEWLTLAAGLLVPRVEILARYEWTNVNPVTIHTALYELLHNKWKVNRVHCDATGIGSASTAFLQSALDKHGTGRVEGVTFDGAWTAHTRLAFQYLACIYGARIVDYATSFDPLAVAGQEAPDRADVDRHAWWQRGHARLEAKPGQKVRAYVAENEGHDDILMSELLMVDAAYNVGSPQVITSGQVDFYQHGQSEQRFDFFVA